MTSSDAQSIDELMARSAARCNLGALVLSQAARALVSDKDRIVLSEHDREEGAHVGSRERDRPGGPARVGRLELMERLMMFDGLWRERPVDTTGLGRFWEVSRLRCARSMS
jgi:hypothetical protein